MVYTHFPATTDDAGRPVFGGAKMRAIPSNCPKSAAKAVTNAIMGTGGYAMPTETWPIAMCPGCQIQMKIMVVKPAKLADRMDEITYECPKCATTTQRQFKQPKLPLQST
jgi:hypothetical protein